MQITRGGQDGEEAVLRVVWVGHRWCFSTRGHRSRSAKSAEVKSGEICGLRRWLTGDLPLSSISRVSWFKQGVYDRLDLYSNTHDLEHPKILRQNKSRQKPRVPQEQLRKLRSHIDSTWVGFS